jgi:hypothetical protein
MKLKVVIVLFIVSIFFAFGANAQVNVAEVRLAACQYLGYDANVNEDGLDKLVQECITKFDKKFDKQIDFEDMDMLYGVEGEDAIIEYLYYMYNMQGATPPDKQELAMRRFLGGSLKEINNKVSKPELIDACLEVFSRGSGVTEFDIPFLVDDGFLMDIVYLIKNNYNNVKKQGKLLAKLQYLIEKTSEHIMTLEQRIKLDDIEMEYSMLDFEYMDNIVNEKIQPNDVRVYLLTKYFNGTSYYVNKTTDALIEEALVTVLVKEKAISGVDIELLIGKGNLYYYLAQQAEALSNSDPKKTERMAQVFLLSSYIYECQSFYASNTIYKNKLNQFNAFFAKYSMEDWMEQKNLPEKYLEELRNRRLKSDPMKIAK